MRRPASLSVAAGALVILLGVLAWWRPFLTDEREYPATVPQPAPLFSTSFIDARPGARVCFRPAVMNSQSGQARFRAKTFSRRGQPLELTIAGKGYRFARRVPGGYPDLSFLTVAVDPPSRDTHVRICIANVGRRKISLLGASDQTRAPLTVTEDGKSIGPAVQFWFYEREPVSIAERLPTIFDRMQVFRLEFLGPWLFWPLAILCVVGTPAAALWALWRSVSDDDAEGADPGLEDEPGETDARRQVSSVAS